MQKQAELEGPPTDVLEKSLLHNVMVFFHLPSAWPSWAIWAASLLLAIAGGGLWYRFLDNGLRALIVTGAIWLFMAADLLLLIYLPRRGISFGPWKAQFFTLALPRVAASVALAPVVIWLGWPWAMALLSLIQLVGTTALIWGTIIEPHRLELTQQEVYTDRLPPDAPPIRLLHISDLHVERLTRREEKVLQIVQETKPDLILITGDYVNLSYNRDPHTQTLVKQLLAQLSAPYGVYATLGSPPVDLRETVVPIFEALPVKLMRDGWTEVDLGEGRRLILVGLDCTHHIPTDAARLQRLMQTAPNSVPQILLYHSPELMPQASGHKLDLYLCGHTHGGQVRLPFVGPILTSSQLGRRYVMGLYKEGRTHLYVSRGIGLEGLSAPRVRFLSPPEMTLFTLFGA